MPFPRQCLRDKSGQTPLDCARAQRADAALLRLLEENCPCSPDSSHQKPSSLNNHTQETAEETEDTSISVSASHRNVDLVEPQDDVSSLGSHDFTETMPHRGPSKFERMLYEI
jgi:hypothetical protein